MFDPLSIGVKDLPQSLTFYDAMLKPLGVSRMFAMGDPNDYAAYVRDPNGYKIEVVCQK